MKIVQAGERKWLANQIRFRLDGSVPIGPRRTAGVIDLIAA